MAFWGSRKEWKKQCENTTLKGSESALVVLECLDGFGVLSSLNED